METVGAYEAKTHLPRLLDRVKRGERIVVTRHGVPVAMLVPADPGRGRSPGQVIEELRSIRVARREGDPSIREMIEEGRR